MDDKFIKIVERSMAKYSLVKITPAKKTIAQSNPLDFPNIPFAEIWIIDVITRIPVPTGVALPELRGALNIPEKFLVIRTENDPTELETQRLYGEEDRIASEDVDPLLNNDPKYHEYNYDADKEPVYGDVYNKRFLEYLAQVAADREYLTASVNAENESKKLNMFSWLKEQPKVEDFNKEFDTVKPVSQLTKKSGGKTDLPAKVANPGNFDTRHRKDTLKTTEKKVK
jgi:hypothetical protein